MYAKQSQKNNTHYTQLTISSTAFSYIFRLFPFVLWFFTKFTKSYKRLVVALHFGTINSIDGPSMWSSPLNQF